jgi:hypothetical protein
MILVAPHASYLLRCGFLLVGARHPRRNHVHQRIPGFGHTRARPFDRDQLFACLVLTM